MAESQKTKFVAQVFEFLELSLVKFWGHNSKMTIFGQISAPKIFTLDFSGNVTCPS